MLTILRDRDKICTKAQKTSNCLFDCSNPADLAALKELVKVSRPLIRL